MRIQGLKVEAARAQGPRAKVLVRASRPRAATMRVQGALGSS